MGEEYKAIFFQRLAYYLNKTGISQVALADKLGVSEAAVSFWVKGAKIPRMDKLQAMAELFGCSLTDLVTETPIDAVKDELFEKKKVLFSMSDKASAEDLDKIITIVKTIVGDD